MFSPHSEPKLYLGNFRTAVASAAYSLLDSLETYSWLRLPETPGKILMNGIQQVSLLWQVDEFLTSKGEP